MGDAVRAGADSVEHGADVDDETFLEMVKRGTVWLPAVDHNRRHIERNLESVRRAVKASVKIGMGMQLAHHGRPLGHEGRQEAYRGTPSCSEPGAPSRGYRRRPHTRG